MQILCSSRGVNTGRVCDTSGVTVENVRNFTTVLSSFIIHLCSQFVTVVFLLCTGTSPPWLFSSAYGGACDVNVKGVRSGSKTCNTRKGPDN